CHRNRTPPEPPGRRHRPCRDASSSLVRYGVDAVTDGVAVDAKPASATVRMPPPFTHHALVVGTVVQVVVPRRVVDRVGIGRAPARSLAAAGELVLVARAAPGAGYQHHRRAILVSGWRIRHLPGSCGPFRSGRGTNASPAGAVLRWR